MPYLLALTLLLTPAYAIRLSLFGLPTNFFMVWVFLFWIIFFAYLIAKKRVLIFLTAVKNIDKKVLILTSLFLLSGLISLSAKGIAQKKIGQFIVLFLQPISIFLISIFIIKQQPKTKSLLLATCYLLLAASGLYAIFQYFTLVGLPPEWWGNSVEPKRAISFFSHPNFYALFTAPLLALLIPHLSGVILSRNASASSTSSWRPEQSRMGDGEESQAKKEILCSASPSAKTTGDKQDDAKFKYLFLISWSVGAIGLLLSMSRAGWLGLAAAIAVYAFVAADKEIRKIVIGAAAILFIIVAIVPNLRYRVTLPFYGEKSTVSRLSLWNTGIKGIKESPITGLGLTGFANNWQKLNTDPNLDTHNFPHNIFLDLWVETGILGLISLIGLIGLIIYRGLRHSLLLSQEEYPASLGEVVEVKDKGLKIKDLPLAVSLFLIALIFQGLIDNPYFKNDLAMVFWIILSLAV